MVELSGIFVLAAAIACSAICLVACVVVSRTVNEAQATRRESFESPATLLQDYETMLPGDEQALLADYRELKQIEEDHDRAMYDGGGW